MSSILDFGVSDLGVINELCWLCLGWHCKQLGFGDRGWVFFDTAVQREKETCFVQASVVRQHVRALLFF